MADTYPVEGSRFDSGSSAYPFAYFAYAASKIGDPMHLEDFAAKLNADTAVGSPNFDYLRAQTFLKASKGEVDGALTALKRAFDARPNSDYRPILTEYQYAEACEWLYQDTRDERFNLALLDWVQRYQKIQPTHAWAYAMEFSHTKDPKRRMRALAMTRYLDPQSPRLTNIQKSDQDRADAWLAGNNPFAIDQPATKEAQVSQSAF